MSRPLFTPEELAELAAFDAEVDAQPDYDPEEAKTQRRRDTEIRWENLPRKEKAIAEKKRAYREANRDAIAEKQRAYYEANRDAIAEKKRERYHETTSDQNAESSQLRRWRREHGYTQKGAAMLLGVSQQQISYYEHGFTPLPERVMEMIGCAECVR